MLLISFAKIKIHNYSPSLKKKYWLTLSNKIFYFIFSLFFFKIQSFTNIGSLELQKNLKVKVDYVEIGNGPKVVLLHSTATGIKQWRYLLENYKNRFCFIAVKFNWLW